MKIKIKNWLLAILIIIIILGIIQLNIGNNTPQQAIFMVALIFIIFLIMYTITIVFPNNFENTLDNNNSKKSNILKVKIRAISIIQKMVSRNSGNGPNAGPM